MKLKQSGDITLTSSYHGRKFLIDYRLTPDKKQKPVILFIHGFKGFKDWGAFNLMADYFAEAGFVFVKMNFSHNGTTIDSPADFADLDAFGRNNFSIEQQDITTVLEYILSEMDDVECNMNEIYMIGHSRGGGAAILGTAKDHRVKKLATLAAMNDLSGTQPEEVMREWKDKGVYYIHNARTNQQMPLYYQIVEDYHTNEEELNVKKAVMRMKKPFIAFHGEADETLPISMLYEMKSWNPGIEIVAMPGVNHTFGSRHPHEENELPQDLQDALNRIIDFFT